ncbi:hypothetical protein JYT26_01890 [Beggiatoa alba]|nr:hypothetical protein [Beggiatoa alba]
MSRNLPLSRFLQTLDIVAREGKHLVYSWGRLYAHPINTDWVRGLESSGSNDFWIPGDPARWVQARSDNAELTGQ